MKKSLTIVLLVFTSLLFIACNGETDERLFNNALKPDIKNSAALLPGGEEETSFGGIIAKKVEGKENITSAVFRVRQTVPADLPETDIVSTPTSYKPAWLSFDNDADPTVLYINTNGLQFIANADCELLFAYEEDHKNVALGSITTLDLGDGIFNTSQVVDMSEMFYGLKNLTSLDVSSFDTSNVEDMGGLFLDCSSLTTVDLSNFDTGKVTDMSSMFNGCYKMKTLDLSVLDTSNVTDMNSMFMYFAQNVEEDVTLDLRTFNTSKVEIMVYMFQEAKISTLVLGETFVSANVSHMMQMFCKCGCNTANVKIDFGALSVPNSLGELDKTSMFSGIAENSTSFKVKGDETLFDEIAIPRLSAATPYYWQKATTPDPEGFYLMEKAPVPSP